MILLEKIRKDVFSAMKTGDQEKAGILQILVANIKNEELKKGDALNEDEEIKVLRSEVKKLKDAIEQYKLAGRQDLVEHDKKQLDIVNEYLPEEMSEEKIRELVKSKIEQVGATSIRDMGKVMGVVMKEAGTNVDGNIVKNIVQEMLNSISQ